MTVSVPRVVEGGRILILDVKWGYDANIIKFFGPTGQSNIRDHAKALNFDLCHARREDHQVWKSM